MMLHAWCANAFLVYTAQAVHMAGIECAVTVRSFMPASAIVANDSVNPVMDSATSKTLMLSLAFQH